MLKVGIVGCGAIGSELARLIAKRFSQTAKLAYLCDHNAARIEAVQKNFKFKCQALAVDQLIRKSDFIIEAASQDAAAYIVPKALRLGRSIMVLSVGGLLRISPRVFRNAPGLLYVPSGAVSGIDGLLAAYQNHIKRVTLTTYKPLKSLEEAPFFKKRGFAMKNIRKPTVIFEGNAKTAIRFFPQNINVAATLSLAGIGAEKTRVRIVTSPHFTRNTHEVQVDGDFGSIRTVTENVPSKTNPKTSALAVYSAAACLEKIFSSVKVGT